jgi:hypothetical protein
MRACPQALTSWRRELECLLVIHLHARTVPRAAAASVVALVGYLTSPPSIALPLAAHGTHAWLGMIVMAECRRSVSMVAHEQQRVVVAAAYAHGTRYVSGAV